MSQGICDYIQKQDTRGVLWKHDVSKIRSLARVKSCRASGDRGPPCDPKRRLRFMWIRCGLPVQQSSAFTGNRVWYVVLFVQVIGRIADRGNTELSAFLIIIWYAYRNRGLFKLSALVRAIVTEASIYFLAMVTAQTCIQVSISFMGVRFVSHTVMQLLIIIVADCRPTAFLPVSIPSLQTTIDRN